MQVSSLDSCQKTFLWTHKEADLAPQPVVGLVLQVGDAKKVPPALGLKSLDPFFFFSRVSKERERERGLPKSEFKPATSRFLVRCWSCYYSVTPLYLFASEQFLQCTLFLSPFISIGKAEAV